MADTNHTYTIESLCIVTSQSASEGPGTGCNCCRCQASRLCLKEWMIKFERESFVALS